MQCPRCGWVNPPDITACHRCGLAVDLTPPRPPAGRPLGYGPAGGYPSADDPQSGYVHGGYTQGDPGALAEGGQHYPSYQYAPPPAQPAGPASYGLPYGGLTGSPVLGGAFPHAGVSGWTAAPSHSSGRLARLLLLVGALASVGYAIWAMTARRGIFENFVDDRAVSLSRARSSDRIDTLLLVVAGVFAVAALAVWLVRLMAGRSRGGGLTVVGFVVSGLGMVCVVVGLVLSGMVGNQGDRVTEGRRAVTATIVTGSGFIALAVGLIIGLVVVNSRRDDEDAQSPGATRQDW